MLDTGCWMLVGRFKSEMKLRWPLFQPAEGINMESDKTIVSQNQSIKKKEDWLC